MRIKDTLTIRGLDGSSTRLAAVGAVEQFAWSPDGRSIAVVAKPPARLGADLFVLDTRTGAARRLTTSAGEHVRSARWSPDGRQLLVERTRFFDQYSESDLALISVGEGTVQPVTKAFPDGGSNVQGYFVRAPLPPAAPGPGRTVQPSQKPRLRTGPVISLDAAGGTAALLEQSSKSCRRILLWGPRAGSARTLRARCYDIGQSRLKVAINAASVAWLYEFVDRQEGEDCVFVWRRPSGAQMLGPKPARCGRSYDDVGTPAYVLRSWYGPTGESIGSVAGDGSLLAFATYRWCYRIESDDCPRGEGAVEGAVWRIEPRRVVRLRRGADVVRIDDVDNNRIVVRGRNDAAKVLDSLGRVVAAPLAPWSQLGGVQLFAGRLFAGNADVLEERTLAGNVVRRWTSPPGYGQRRLQDVDRGLAVSVGGTALHVLRISDGRTVTFRLPNVGRNVHAAIGRGGLFYGYDALLEQRPGRGGFIPDAELRRALASG